MVTSDILFSTFLAFVGFLCGPNVQAEVCPRIVSRLAWDAEEPRATKDFKTIPQFVVICHTVTPECRDQTTCSARVRSMQDYHMNQKHFNDIGYNFMVGEDGAVYEGRGWNHVGSQVSNYNNRSIGIAFIGNFGDRVPDAIALEAAQKLIKCGVSKGEIPQEYKLVGHRQLTDTISPGDQLYAKIQTWPRWTSNLDKE